jgi:DNA-binding CsgD family transcriptional regulator
MVRVEIAVRRMTINAKDLRTITRIVARPDEGDPGEPLPWSVLAGLYELVSCDFVTFTMVDSRNRACPITQEFPAEPTDASPTEPDWLTEAFWTHYWESKPCCYPDRSADLTSVVTVSDFCTEREFRSTGMYSDYLRWWFPGGCNEIMLCLSSSLGRTIRLLFWRGAGSDFSERDRTLLTLLRPHLDTTYRDLQRRRQPSHMLTTRQRELLSLVAHGHTNGQTARRLGVAEGTVRKHLEHIYRRLDVTSRTAAIMVAFPSGIDRIDVA